MADEVIKSLAVRVSGDLSELETALQRVPSMVQAASSALSSSLGSAAEGATTSFTALGGGVDAVATNLAALSSAMSNEAAATQNVVTVNEALLESLTGESAAAAAAAEALKGTGAGAGEAGGHVENFTEQVEHNKAALEELGEGLTNIGKGLLVSGAALIELTEHFSELAGESVTLASNLKFSETALTTFFSSAEKTKEVLESVKGIADSSVFAFPELLGATQRLAAFMPNAEKLPEVLRAAAMAAEAVGGASASIDTAVQSLIRLNDGGQLNARTLRALGLTTSDVAKQMEAAGNTFDAVLAAIKLKDEELYNALGNQYPVQLNKLKTAWEEVLVTMGQSLVPAATSALNALKPVIALAQEGAEWFGQLPAPVKDLAIILGGLAVATGPVVLGLGAMFFAVGELIEGVPKVLEALTALTAENEAAAVSAGEAAVALEAEGAAAAGAAPEIAAAGTAAAGSAVGWKTLGLAVGFYGAAGAVGYGIGDFLAAQSRKGSDALRDLQEAAAKLGVNLHQQSLSGDELSGALAKLEAMAKKLGITMAQGDQSNQEFIATLIKAITVHNQATESTEKHSAALQKLEDEQSKANAKVKEAKEALDLVKASADGSAESQRLLNRATEEYEKALASANVVLKSTTQEQTIATKAWDEAEKVYSKIPDDIDAYVLSISQGGPKAAAMLNEINTALTHVKSASDQVSGSAKVMVDSWIPGLEELKKKVQDFDLGIGEQHDSFTQWKKDWIGVDEALGDVDSSLQTLMKDLPDGFVLIDQGGKTLLKFVDTAGSVALNLGNLENGIRVLRSASVGLAADTGQLNDSWVYLNGTWRTAADVLQHLNSVTSGASAAAADIVRAQNDANDAYRKSVAVYQDVVDMYNRGEASARAVATALRNVQSAAQSADPEIVKAGNAASGAAAGFDQLAASAQKAGDSMAKANAQWAARDASMSFGMNGNFETSGPGTLAMYAEAGALSSTLDQLAQSLGYVKVGERQYQDLATFNAGLKAANAGFQYVFANGNFQIVYDNANASVNKQTAATTKQTVATQDTTAATQSATAANQDLAGVSAGLSNIFTDTGASATAASSALDNTVVTVNGVETRFQDLDQSMKDMLTSMQANIAAYQNSTQFLADQQAALRNAMNPASGTAPVSSTVAAGLQSQADSMSALAKAIAGEGHWSSGPGGSTWTAPNSDFSAVFDFAKPLNDMSSAFPVFDTQTNKWVQTVQLGLRTITESAADFNTVVAKIGADITAASTGHVAGEFDIPLSGPKSTVSTSTVKQGPTLDQQVANLSAGLTAMGAQPVQSVSIVVSGNTILDDPTAKALANRMMDAAVSRLRTGAGLLR